MPSRRRLPPSSVAALPASRHPLGTLQLPCPPAHTGSQSPQLGLKTEGTNICAGQDLVSRIPEKITKQRSEANMAPHQPLDSAPATSIAEAKLERQRRRIQEAEAALNAPTPLDKRIQVPRAKTKQWRPFDFTADSGQSNPPGDGGVPVSEVRVNTFRPTSRASSLTRSMSVLSHRTNETGPSDMERQDSAVITEDGFRLFKGRRNRKNMGELSAYEDKPEERQTTVEATFDKREIYDVFGNALPGSEFIEENVGYKNGQLQFIQHPNGDVSAHQWSTERYIWENIGQFSNIRKKVEGQLASDRLKGETTYQTLQQNTLAYFRTIAKQREANAMGLPFGVKDIQAAMPEPRTELSAAPTGLKEPPKDMSATEHPPRQLPGSRPPFTSQDCRYNSMGTEVNTAAQPYYTQNLPQAPRIDRFNNYVNYGQQIGKQDDPFYAAGSYQQIYGRSPYGNPHYGHLTNSQSATPEYQNLQTTQDLNYDFQFPNTAPIDRRTQGPGASMYGIDGTGFADTVAKQRQQTYVGRAGIPSNQHYPQAHNVDSSLRTNLGAATANRGSVAANNVGPDPKLVTPHDTRAAMRGNLWKQVETAERRSLSQDNRRTVLHDPFQRRSSETQVEAELEPEHEDLSPVFSRNVTGNTLQPPASFDPTSSKFFPTLLAPRIDQPTSPVDTEVKNNLRESSPDPYPRKVYHNSTPLITTSESKPTPQTLKGPFFPAAQALHSSIGNASLSGAGKKAYDEKLSDWWTSGNKFARQEEFYQSVTNTRKEFLSVAGSSPAHLTPIGPPSRTPLKQQPSPAPTATRLLIPVLENLASYVQGPIEKRRDYFSQWSKAPEWCIDRSESGNDSFFDKNWGTPPARVGRDPRYSGRSWNAEQTLQRSPYVGSGGRFGSVGGGLDRRFAFAGRY